MNENASEHDKEQGGFLKAFLPKLLSAIIREHENIVPGTIFEILENFRKR